MSLKDLQKTFRDIVILGDMRTPLPVVENNLDQEARLSIYQRNTYGTLTEFLELSYPKTYSSLDKKTFKSIIKSFIQQHPPKAPALDDFAFPFESFIEKEVSPFVHAVAQFENKLRATLLQPMPSSLDPKKLEQLAKKDPENLRFTFHPTATLYEAQYAFHEFWHQLEDHPAEYAPKPSHFLIHLDGMHSAFKPLGKAEWYFLKALQEGHRMEDALEKAFIHDPAFDLAKKLQYYMTYKVFRDAIINNKNGGADDD